MIDLSGKKTTLTSQWASEHGLAWAPSGDEVWFTATEAGANRSLYAVTLAGKLRVVTRVPGGLKLHDIAKNGRVLLTRESPRVGIRGMLAGDERERDMSFLDYSFAVDWPRTARPCSSTRKGKREAPTTRSFSANRIAPRSFVWAKATPSRFRPI